MIRMAKSFFQPISPHSGFTQHLTSFDGSHTQSKHALKYAWISITIGYLLGSHVAIIWVVIHKKMVRFFGKKSCISSPCWKHVKVLPALPVYHVLKVNKFPSSKVDFQGNLYQHLKNRHLSILGISRTLVPGQITWTIIVHKPDDSRTISGVTKFPYFSPPFWGKNSPFRGLARSHLDRSYRSKDAIYFSLYLRCFIGNAP